MRLCQNKPVQRRLKVVFLLCLVLARSKRACGPFKPSDHSSCTPCEGDCAAAPFLQHLSRSLRLPHYSHLRIWGSENIEKVSFSYTHQGAPYGQGVTQARGAQYPLRQVPSGGSECWDRAANRVYLGPKCPFQCQVYLIRRTLCQLLEMIQREWKIFFHWFSQPTTGPGQVLNIY